MFMYLPLNFLGLIENCICKVRKYISSLAVLYQICQNKVLCSIFRTEKLLVFFCFLRLSMWNIRFLILNKDSLLNLRILDQIEILLQHEFGPVVVCLSTFAYMPSNGQSQLLLFLASFISDQTQTKWLRQFLLCSRN